MPASWLVSSRATARIGPNSPIAPTDSTVGPNEDFSTPESRRMGSRVVSAVVVRHSPTTTVSSTSPVDSRTAPTPNASTSDPSQAVTARAMCPSRMRVTSSSRPARNIKYVRPRSDNAVTTLLVRVNASTDGPMRTPSRIWMTTSGTGTMRRERSARMGATTAARAMSSSVGRASVAVNGYVLAVSP